MMTPEIVASLWSKICPEPLTCSPDGIGGLRTAYKSVRTIIDQNFEPYRVADLLGRLFIESKEKECLPVLGATSVNRDRVLYLPRPRKTSNAS
jgi:hypothetical protein